MRQNGILHNTPSIEEKNTGDKTFTMEQQAKDSIESLFERGSNYLETRIDLYKLKAIDKSSDVLSSAISMIIVFITLLLFIVIINIGIALLLGELLGKAYYGFFVLAGIYLITGIIFYNKRDTWFKVPIVNKLIAKFF